MISVPKKLGNADETRKLWLRVTQLVTQVYTRPSDLNGVEWADTYRHVAGGASPGKWKTATQPIAAGPMVACTDPKISVVALMVFTQGIKTESLITAAMFYIHQDPSDILWVFPTQDFAGKFSKGRFKRNVDVTPVIHELISHPKYRASESTISHVEYPGGALDFVSPTPTGLSSRPVRVILLDEIDKYPASVATLGDPIRLATERASTFAAQGRSKVIMACSPTVEGFSRIGKAYADSDRRKCFLPCPHCGHKAIMTWANVRFDKDEQGNPLPKTAGLWCDTCGAIWSERERIAAIDALMTEPAFGWRQTREFTCCGDEEQVPEQWDHEGRSLCRVCGERSKFDGKAGFNASKLYSKRHRLSDIVQQWNEARGDIEQMRVWSNEAMAELFQHRYTEKFWSNALMARAEVYGPNDCPAGVKLITAFCDTQDNRLEILVVGWSWDEEAYVLVHHVIHGNPSTQPQVWQELDQLRAMTFKVRGQDTILRIAALGVDSAGHNTAAVLAYCNARNVAGVGRVFATRGQDGPIPLWPHRGSLSKIRKRETFFNIGVSTGKELVTARLAMTPPEPGFRKPGFIHFPVGLDLEFYEQLNSERQLRRMRAGQEISFWKKVRERNEAFDMIVGALCVRRYFGRIIGGGNLAVPAEEALIMAPTTLRPAPPSPAPATPAAPSAALSAAIDSDDEEVTKVEFEKMILEHPEIPYEVILSAMRVAEEAEKTDPATAAARERCRELGIGDFDGNRPKQPPGAISESDTDSDEAWLRQVLEKRRAKMAEQAQAQPRGADPAHRMPQRPQQQQQQQSWAQRGPRRHGLYAALDD